MTAPTPAPRSGVVIQSQSVASRLHPSWFFGVVVALFILVFILGGRAVLVLLLIGAVVLAAIFYRSILAAFGWRPATLELPSSQLALGSSPQLIYRRRPRKVSDIPECEVECQLICEERATYRQGTDTRTDTERVCEMLFQGRGGGTPRV